jgi:hypothetical protein
MASSLNSLLQLTDRQYIVESVTSDSGCLPSTPVYVFAKFTKYAQLITTVLSTTNSKH